MPREGGLKRLSFFFLSVSYWEDFPSSPCCVSKTEVICHLKLLSPEHFSPLEGFHFCFYITSKQ